MGCKDLLFEKPHPKSFMFNLELLSTSKLMAPVSGFGCVSVFLGSSVSLTAEMISVFLMLRNLHTCSWFCHQAFEDKRTVQICRIGVPQRSILGPLLVCVHINRLLDSHKKRFIVPNLHCEKEKEKKKPWQKITRIFSINCMNISTNSETDFYQFTMLKISPPTSLLKFSIFYKPYLLRHSQKSGV